MRADARRNRERVLAAASEAFAEEGFEVGVAEIARRAGVGTGTLFRHFPTKLDLEVAVVLERSQGMRDVLAAALAEPDPWRGFAQMMESSVEMTSCDRCIGQAVSEEMLADPRLSSLRDDMLEGIETLLERGRSAGVIRRDVAAQDVPVLSAAIGATMERYSRTQPDLWRRYLGVVLDGLRADGAAPLSPGPPDAAVLDDVCSAPPAGPLPPAR